MAEVMEKLSNVSIVVTIRGIRYTSTERCNTSIVTMSDNFGKFDTQTVNTFPLLETKIPPIGFKTTFQVLLTTEIIVQHTRTVFRYLVNYNDVTAICRPKFL